MTTTAREWIELIVEHAAGLRASGVTSIKADGFEAHISPDISLAEGSVGHIEQNLSDPIDDPATYGGYVPSFPRRNEL